MKTKLIPALLAATLISANAQSGTSAVPKSNANSSTSTSSSSSSGGGSTRAGAPRGQGAYAAAGSSARYGTRLNSIVRRGSATAGPGSIILTSPLEPEKFNQLTEDLNVLTLIINRNLDRVFGEKSTEYRLGVPMTMAANRSVETSYIEDYGVLVRINVPFPVASSGEREKKPEPAAAPDTEWEKARRALHAGDIDPTTGLPNGVPAIDPNDAPAYNESLIEELKKEILDALKNVANVRNMRANEAATVAIIGAADPMPVSIDPLSGLPLNPNANRPSVLTIRIQKGDAGDDLAKKAKFATYFDTPVTPSQPGGYGGGGLFGTGYSYQTVPDVRR